MVDLNAIKARHGSVVGRRMVDVARSSAAVRMVTYDIPDLIAEVERLAARLEVYEKDQPSIQDLNNAFGVIANLQPSVPKRMWPIAHWISRIADLRKRDASLERFSENVRRVTEGAPT